MQLAPRLLSYACLLSAAAALGAMEPAASEAQVWRATAFAKGRETALAIEDPFRRAEALARLARTHADHDAVASAHRSLHLALEAARSIEEPAFRDWILHDIALAQLRVDDVHGARETAHLIATERPQGAVLAALADRDLRAGDLQSVEAIAGRIRDSGSRGLVLRQLIALRAARGEIEPAQALLKAISDPFYQALARGDLAAAEVRAGRIARAQAWAARAPRKQRDEVYGRIALERAAARDVSGALETLRSVRDELAAALVRGRIGAQAARATGGPLLHAAVAAATRVESSPRKALTLARLARLQLAAGDEAGLETLRSALAETQRLSPGEQRDDALEYIANAQAREGDLKGALDSAIQVSDRATRAVLVRDLVTLQRMVEAASAAASVQEFQDPLIEAAALFGVLGVQSQKSGKPSTETIDAARAAVQRIEAPLQPAAFAALAAARLQTGDPTIAAQIFQEALDAAAAIDRPELRAKAYVRIIDALSDRLLFLGEPAKARPAEEAPGR